MLHRTQRNKKEGQCFYPEINKSSFSYSLSLPSPMIKQQSQTHRCWDMCVYVCVVSVFVCAWNEALQTTGNPNLGFRLRTSELNHLMIHNVIMLSEPPWTKLVYLILAKNKKIKSDLFAYLPISLHHDWGWCIVWRALPWPLIVNWFHLVQHQYCACHLQYSEGGH